MSEVTASLLSPASCCREGSGADPWWLVASQLSSADVDMVGVAQRRALSGGAMAAVHGGGRAR